MTICNIPGCPRKAFHAQFFGQPIRCTDHKEHYKPQYKICMCGSHHPSYNFEGEKRPKCCGKCKTEGMINIRDRKCKCGKTFPSFNLEGNLKSEYCADCKEDGMIQVLKRTKCKCGVSPSYNFKGLPVRYCVNCKEDGMIRVNDPVCKCGTNYPIYNFRGKTPKYCRLCKEDGMITITGTRCKCGTKATFNYEGIPPRFCKKCKESDMIIIYQAKCKGQDGYCPVIGNPKYRGYCTFCFAHTFPLDPLTPMIRRNTKEIAVRNYINSEFEGFQHDKALWIEHCECDHRRRIDHYKMINNTYLCIETDENQHKYYNKEDEKSRYNDLFMMHGGKFIFIRFNPDKYVDSNNEKCNPSLESRYQVLQDEINTQLARIENEENKEFIEEVYLFYDA
jgi:hypothetical protein